MTGAMRAFLLAVAIVVLIGVAAMFVLDRELQRQADESFTSPH
jgi:hypothetical protein